MNFMSITESTYQHRFSNEKHDVVCYNVGIFVTEQKEKENWNKLFLEFLNEITKLQWINHGGNGECLKGTFNFRFAEISVPNQGITLTYENSNLVKGSTIANGVGINKNYFHLALLKRMYDSGWELKDFAELPERHWTFQKAVSITSTKKIKLEEYQKE